MAEAASWESDAPLVIAHRGASARAPENTLAAFRLAASMGAHAIELDAKLTRDGEIVVHHDRSVERTTNEFGMVHQLTLEEIRKLDAGSAFGEAYAGERIPTLREVLELFHGGLLINIELTNYVDPFDPLPEKALALVQELDLQENVLFSSFNPIALRKLQNEVRLERLALLMMTRQPRFLRALFRRWAPHGWVHPQVGLPTEGWVESRQHQGLRLNVWTVNDLAQMSACFKMGVDGIITDFPDLALGVRREYLQDMQR
jgi:glycerophosphoryl diester phosphodiesterase